MTRFKSVVFDVDSTLSGLEGIDWLAARRGPDIAEWSTELTRRAMNGEIPIEAVYGERMRAVKPRKDEIDELGRLYVEHIAAGARELFDDLRAEEIEVVMVSGGLREAILPLANQLGVAADHVHAVSVYFDGQGRYSGFDESSLMTQQNGKRITVGTLGLAGPILAVGDGMTDTAMKPVVDAFAAFVGFVRREPVVEQADFVFENFDQLRALVLT